MSVLGRVFDAGGAQRGVLRRIQVVVLAGHDSLGEQLATGQDVATRRELP